MVLKGHTPAGSPTRNAETPRPLKLTIKLGGNTPAVESSSKKRVRSESSAKLELPVAKMARALGTVNVEAEAALLQHKLAKEKKKSK